MKRLMAVVQTAGYHSDSDPDYEPGDEVEVVTRPRTGSETQADTSFNGSTGASSVLNRTGRSRRSSLATSVSTTKSVSEKRALPYWVKEVSKAEKFDPELGKFVADDKFYKEEKDPDYVLPGSDIDVETEEEEEDPEELSQLQKEAGDDLPEEILEGKYKEKKKIVSPVKVTLTPSKEGEGEAEPTEEILTLETEVEELKADAAKGLEAPRCYIPIWVPVESPSERIKRAKDELAASGITEDLV